MQPRRLKRFTIYVFIILILLGLANVWRFFGINAERDVFAQYGSSVSPIVRMVLAAVWAVVFVGLGVAVLRRWPQAKIGVPLALVAYALMNLILPTPNLPILYWHIILIIFTAWVLQKKPIEPAS